MAEHERTTQGKNDKVDQKHRTRQQESQPSSDTLHAWDQGLLTLTETPFTPGMDEHAVILSSIPFSAQRHEFIMRLHQTYGNRYVQRLVESVRAQAKLDVSDPNDVYEQEADRVADAVVRAEASQIQHQEIPEEEEEVQMQPAEEEEEVQAQRQAEEEEPVQEKTVLETQRQELPEEELQAQLAESQGTTVSESLETSINNARGSGHHLSDNIREPMEQAFGADFSGVRLHTDSEADTLNQHLSARAFTTGQDIFFREGEYSPGSGGGQKLLAHELTHVVQQTSRRKPQRQVGKKKIVTVATSVNWQTYPKDRPTVTQREKTIVVQRLTCHEAVANHLHNTRHGLLRRRTIPERIRNGMTAGRMMQLLNNTTAVTRATVNAIPIGAVVSFWSGAELRHTGIMRANLMVWGVNHYGTFVLGLVNPETAVVRPGATYNYSGESGPLNFAQLWNPAGTLIPTVANENLNVFYTTLAQIRTQVPNIP